MRRGDLPRRIVALGGGTGMPAVLRGLRSIASDADAEALTAVVTMSDDGGSSGRLRRSSGLPPPGDVRNCLVALSDAEDLLAALFQHRYAGGEELEGHNLGNLILAALAEQTGSFLKAVEVSSQVLRTTGRILPVTLEDVTLEAQLEDGSRIVGESAIGSCPAKIERVSLLPRSARPTPGVVEAIHRADLIVLGPGSLFTSVVPNLVLDEIREAFLETRAVRILIGNLVSERGEAAGLDLGDHLQVIEQHAGRRAIDALVAHDGPVDAQMLERYRAEGVRPLRPPERDPVGTLVIRDDLLASGPKLRHDAAATRAALLRAWREARHQPRAQVAR
jgi:uncharacterized cofD-like protein